MNFPLYEAWLEKFQTGDFSGAQCLAVNWDSIPEINHPRTFQKLCCRPPFRTTLIEFVGLHPPMGVFITQDPWNGALDFDDESIASGILGENPRRYSFQQIALAPNGLHVVNPAIVTGFSEDGALLKSGSSDHWPVAYFNFGKKGEVIPLSESESTDEVTKHIRVAVECSLFVCALTHVDNIAIQDEPLSRTIRRRLSKRDIPGVDDVRVKTLKIVPFSTEKRLGSDRRSSGYGYVPAHLVRGHFATYTPARPLFGKYTGTFWMPQHVRGNPVYGRVEKRYVVAATDDDLPQQAVSKGLAGFMTH